MTHRRANTVAGPATTPAAPQATTSAVTPALRVRDVDVVYASRLRRGQEVHAVRKASLDVHRGEVVGVLGESGSGKSSLARAIVGLTPYRNGTIEIGTHGPGPEPTGRQLGRPVQMIFQDPRTSLDPSMRILDIVTEPLIYARRPSREWRRRMAADALAAVELDASALHRYPRHFSGGQQQRIAIARGLIVDPELLVCDEIVSALDVSTQGTILNLLRRIVAERDMSTLFISHDVSVLGYLCDSLVVMRDGVIVEAGPTDDVLGSPTDEFTKMLIDAVPQLVDADGRETP